MKNKKGGFIPSIEIIWIIPRLILVLIVVFAIMLIVNSYVVRDVDTAFFQDSIMLNYLLSSESCLVDHNDYVDISKFNVNTIKNCVGSDVGGRFTLFDVEGNKIGESVEVREDILLKRLKLCNIGEHDEFYCDFRKYYVLLKNEEVQPAFLQVEIIR